MNRWAKTVQNSTVPRTCKRLSGTQDEQILGNGIDPLEIIDKYGADALRLTLITGNAPGNDMRFYMERVEANRNFANKVWNASRFILMNMEGKEVLRMRLRIWSLPISGFSPV